jgi:hypothetical protein
MPLSDTVSVDNESIGSDSDVDDIVLSHPMFYILGQFLRTEDGTNIATCIQELTKEVKECKQLLSAFVKLRAAASQ